MSVTILLRAHRIKKGAPIAGRPSLYLASLAADSRPISYYGTTWLMKPYGVPELGVLRLLVPSVIVPEKLPA